VPVVEVEERRVTSESLHVILRLEPES